MLISNNIQSFYKFITVYSFNQYWIVYINNNFNYTKLSILYKISHPQTSQAIWRDENTSSTCIPWWGRDAAK